METNAQEPTYRCTSCGAVWKAGSPETSRRVVEGKSCLACQDGLLVPAEADEHADRSSGS